MHQLTRLLSCSILTRDEKSGSVEDILVDDRDWAIRYLVVNTGGVIKQHPFLISPESAGTPDWDREIVPVELTSAAIEEGPDVESVLPLSRAAELELVRYYKWPAYWIGPGAVPPAELEEMSGEENAESGDSTLRSALEINGYTVDAIDGNIGHVSDMLVDEDTWTIRYFVVDIGSWINGQKRLMSPLWVLDLHWNERRIVVDLDREMIQNGPDYDPSVQVERPYEEELVNLYGKPAYWKKVREV